MLESQKISFVEVVEKYKKNNKIMIYLKKVIKKLDKYIDNKNGRKYKKLEINILKNIRNY